MNRREFLKISGVAIGALIVPWQWMVNYSKGPEPNGDRMGCLFYLDTTGHPEQEEIEWFLAEQASRNFKRFEIVRTKCEYMFLGDFPEMWRCVGSLKVWGFTDMGRKKFGENFLRVKGLKI